jgi:hypothetical protein
MGVFSDIHGNYLTFDAVFADIKKLSVDSL